MGVKLILVNGYFPQIDFRSKILGQLKEDSGFRES